MRKLGIVLGILCAAGAVFAQTFTDLAGNATYEGKTGLKKLLVAIDANNAKLESTGVDITTDDITAAGADTASLDINIPASTNAQNGTITVKSAQAVANLTDNDYIRYILLNMYNSATAAVNYAYIDVEADDVTTATEDGSIDFYIEVNSTATKALDLDATGGTFAGQVIATEAKVDSKYAVVGPDATTGLMVATGSTTNGGTVTFGAVFGSQTPFVTATPQGAATNAAGGYASARVTSRNATNCVIACDGFVAGAAATVHVIAVGTRP